MKDITLKNSVEKFSERRIIAICTDDLDAVNRKGEGKVLHDTHNFENIGCKVDYTMGEIPI